jgi:hypothetical protein
VESNSENQGIVISGGTASGNFSVGNNNEQNYHVVSAPEADPILDRLEQIRQLLGTYVVPDRQAALEALTDLQEDSREPAGRFRLLQHLDRLKGAIGSAAKFAAPLAELAAAIADLLGSRP